MTERLYYDQTYLKEFDANVTAVSLSGGTARISLDRSAFYPTSGGQPFDTGTLEGKSGCFKVIDVEVDKEGEVWHTLKGEGCPLPGEKLHGRIDWARRFDHMQQHGGEHMLAGAVWTLYRGTTIGLHLGERESTIDVTMPDGSTRFDESMIRALEKDVNDHIWQDDEVRCWFPDEEELKALPLRKPPTVAEHVRIVAFGDYEMVACGGTHPSSAGQIGLVKILSVTPAKGKARIAFVCGGRAYRELSACRDACLAAGRQLSCTEAELSESVRALKDKLLRLEKENRELLSDSYLKQLEAQSGILILEGGEVPALQEAVSRYIRQPGRIVLASIGPQLIFARSEDGTQDMCALIRKAGRGGGRPDMAGGTGGAEAVRAAAKLLGLE